MQNPYIEKLTFIHTAFYALQIKISGVEAFSACRAQILQRLQVAVEHVTFSNLYFQFLQFCYFSNTFCELKL